MGRLGIRERTEHNRSVIQLSDETASAEEIEAATAAALLLQGFVMIKGAKRQVRWAVLVTVQKMFNASIEAVKAFAKSA